MKQFNFNIKNVDNSASVRIKLLKTNLNKEQMEKISITMAKIRHEKNLIFNFENLILPKTEFDEKGNVKTLCFQENKTLVKYDVALGTKEKYTFIFSNRKKQVCNKYF